jgi:diguanylate cyclase (GGDEF)-like protein
MTRLYVGPEQGLASRDRNLDVRGQKGIRHAPNGLFGMTPAARPRESADGRPPAGLPTPVPTTGFLAAAKAVLTHLQTIAPMAAWAVIRYDDGDSVLEAVVGPDPDYSAEAMASGSRVRWSSLICSRMVDGAGPRIAPDVHRVPAYASAPITRRLPVGAYAGVPLTYPDGTLAGSVCGLDPSPQPESLADVLPMLQLSGDLLSRLWASERTAEHERARAEQAERRAVTDALTGITNRLGWEEALASEQARAARRGLWTGVVSVDLDELKQMNDRFGHQAGDALLLAAAQSLQAVVRREDVLARVGGDEFAVLVSDCDADCLDRLIRRLRAVLDTVGVRASVGAVSVPTGTSLRDAWQLADQEMYAEKHSLGHRQLDLDLTDEALRTG